jgi:hypothetical protein
LLNLAVTLAFPAPVMVHVVEAAFALPSVQLVEAQLVKL